MQSQQDKRPGHTGAKATRVRWGILAILFIVTTLNYADRATISIAGPELKRLLGLTPVEMGFVFSAFVVGVYADDGLGWFLYRRYRRHRVVCIALAGRRGRSTILSWQQPHHVGLVSHQ